MPRSLVLALVVVLILAPAGAAGQNAALQPTRGLASQPPIPETDILPHALPPMPGPGPAYQPGVVLVKPAATADDAFPDDWRTLLAQSELQPVRRAHSLGIVVVAAPVGEELDTARRLAVHPGIAYAEPNYYAQYFAPVPQTAPDDRFYASHQWNLRHIGAEAAWDLTTGSGAVSIAVVDSGVDMLHPDLRANLTTGYDIVNDDPNPNDIVVGHGTHVASVAAAVTNNTIGMAGVSWQSKIMPVRVGGPLNLSILDVAAGIRWAVDHGAAIINLSLGTDADSQTLRDAVVYAHGQGALLVAAAGNSHQDGDPLYYPAAYPEVLAVAASNNLDQHASYSSSGSHIDVAAPGGDPTSPDDPDLEHWIFGAVPAFGFHDFALGAGTSFAAPHVAGLAALLLSLDPNLSNEQLAAVITGTAKDIGDPGWDPLTGHGRIDLAAAAAAVTGSPTPTPTPTATPALPLHLYLPTILARQ